MIIFGVFFCFGVSVWLADISLPSRSMSFDLKKAMTCDSRFILSSSAACALSTSALLPTFLAYDWCLVLYPEIMTSSWRVYCSRSLTRCKCTYLHIFFLVVFIQFCYFFCKFVTIFWLARTLPRSVLICLRWCLIVSFSFSDLGGSSSSLDSCSVSSVSSTFDLIRSFCFAVDSLLLSVSWSSLFSSLASSWWSSLM